MKTNNLHRNLIHVFLGFISAGLGLLLIYSEGVAKDVTGSEKGKSAKTYSATIYRTEFGVPHIRANDWDDLGFGIGYALAEDGICDIAQIYVTARAERCLSFGITSDNLISDFYRERLIDSGITEKLLSRPETRPSEDYLALVRGYVNGYNQYLRDTGVNNLPDGRCRGAEWVKEITEMDYLRNRTAGRRCQLDNVAAIVAAAPPKKTGALNSIMVAMADPIKKAIPSAAVSPLEFENFIEGSNGWAFGSAATQSGGGILLSNPHTTWALTTPPSFSPGRYLLFHVTIPRKINSIGISRAGSAVQMIFHNESVARAATVSTAGRDIVYRLRLDPTDPTSYMYDGRARKMEQYPVTVKVRRLADGSFEKRSTTLYWTHFGPVIESSTYPWTTDTAYALRSGNREPENIKVEEHKLALNRARSVREVLAIHKKYQVHDNNTTAVDSSGETLFADIGNIPHVDDGLVARCGTVSVLDGSRSECELGTDPDSARPGIFGPSRGVVRLGAPYVANSNNAPWLYNLDDPITGLDQFFGPSYQELSLRARLGLKMVLQRLDGTDGLPGKKFTLENLDRIFLQSRNYGGELLRNDLVNLCGENPTVSVPPPVGDVDIREACDVLANWDLTDQVNSRGPHVFREFVQFGGLRYAVPFNVNDPVNTPNTLDQSDVRVPRALAQSVKLFRDAGIALNARLGDVQYARRGEERIPIPGGRAAEGGFNVLDLNFAGAAGYLVGETTTSSTGFVMIVEFPPDAPVKSRGMLVYSMSSNPVSPHYADMTRNYQKHIINWRFQEHEIQNDPHLVKYVVTDKGREDKK